MKVYTGIGSRSTPAPVLGIFEHLAYVLAEQGWTVRSGCAKGADTAFETGALRASDSAPLPELYLPWSGFEGRIAVTRETPQREAFDIAARFHPAWANLKQGAQKLHARNVHQILGPDVTAPVLSRFVVCWTPDASGSGGTGQALRIAKHYGIEIVDAGGDEGLDRITAFLTP